MRALCCHAALRAGTSSYGASARPPTTPAVPLCGGCKSATHSSGGGEHALPYRYHPSTCRTNRHDDAATHDDAPPLRALLSVSCMRCLSSSLGGGSTMRHSPARDRRNMPARVLACNYHPCMQASMPRHLHPRRTLPSMPCRRHSPWQESLGKAWAYAWRRRIAPRSSNSLPRRTHPPAASAAHHPSYVTQSSSPYSIAGECCDSIIACSSSCCSTMLIILFFLVLLLAAKAHADSIDVHSCKYDV
jgi:hypothetical protein